MLLNIMLSIFYYRPFQDKQALLAMQKTAQVESHTGIQVPKVAPKDQLYTIKISYVFEKLSK